MMTINICIGSACHRKGSYNVVSAVLAGDDRGVGARGPVELTGVFCLGHCTDAVSHRSGMRSFSVNTDNVGGVFSKPGFSEI